MMRKLGILAVCAALAACGGGGGGSSGGSSDGPPPAPPVVTLSAPVTQVLAGAKAVNISATVSTSDSISWQLAAGAPGSITGSGATVQYTPPASVSANTPVVLTAKAGSTSRNITLTVFPDPGAPGLSLIAGSLGDNTLLDGPGDTARFSHITEAARTTDGGLLVADQITGNINFNALRKIGADRKVSTLLRTAPGHVDGDLSQARLGSISGLAQTADGTIWFLDAFGGKNYLRRLSNGTVSTVLDNGSYGIQHVYSAPGATLYMTTLTTVLRMDANASTPTTLAGADVAAGQPPLDGTGAAARFSQIADLAIAPSGDLFVADSCTLRKVTAAGEVSTIAGQALKCQTDGVDGAVDTARFQSLASVAVNAAGDALLLDAYRVRKLSGGIVSTLYTVPAISTTPIYQPKFNVQKVRLSAAGELLLVRDGEFDQLAGSQLQAYAGLENDSRVPVDGVGAAARFIRPSQLAADLAGNIYAVDDIVGFDGFVTSHYGLSLRKIAPNGTVTTLYAVGSPFARPAGIATAPDGTLYVVEQAPEARLISKQYGGAIYKVGTDGKLTLLAGQPLSASPGEQVDGQGAAARFIEPWMAGVDGDGNIYVTDSAKVRKITPDGMVSTIASLPAGLGRAPDGLLYKVDQLTSRAIRVNADGSETTIAGGAELPGTVLGSLPGGLSEPRTIVPTGPYSFAVTSGGAVLRLVLPH
jgi:hypothetical protein